MKQTLIDKFKPDVENLSQAKFLQKALEVLPDETLDGEIDPYSFPRVSLSRDNIVHICYDIHSGEGALFKVRFPVDSRNCIVYGSVCTFEYDGNKYKIN